VSSRYQERRVWNLILRNCVIINILEALDIPLICPKCSVSSLKIISSIELPSDSRSDEISVQLTGCSRCDFTGLAVYEESRRGSLYRESVTHRGCYVNPTHLAAIRRLITQCPDHRNPQCHCKAHHTLGRVNAKGRWNGLDDILSTSTYNIKLK